MKFLNVLNKNRLEKKQNNSRKMRNRVISIVVSAALMTNSLPLSGLPTLSGLLGVAEPVVSAAYEPGYPQSEFSNTSFQDINKFIAYCYYYHTDETFADNHKGDAISIAITDTSTELSTDFYSLGTFASPFEGSVTFGSSGNYSMSSHSAFFAYLSDKATVSGLRLTRLSDVGDGESKPLFAEHVVAGGGMGTWSFESAGSCTYSGVIGEIGDGAHVNLTYTNGANTAVVFNGASTDEHPLADAGAICGKMGASSGLTLSYTGSISHAVTSANGNAGGLVGSMGSGASLTISSSASPTAYAPTVTGKGYAGGLVGDMASDATITNRPSTIGGSVKGDAAAGGLYGRYAYTTATTLTLTDADFQTTATVSGGFCGGLYGELATNGGLTITSGNTAVSYSTMSTGGGCFGGVIGKLTTATLTDTVKLQNLKVNPTANATFSVYGGVIGKIASASYVEVDTVEVNAGGSDKTSSFGGVIGETADTNGVFVNLSDFTLTGNGFKGGGVVGNFHNGVLRLSGTTDMSAGKPADAENCGQLVGQNDNVLVYALGTGSDANWTFKRSNGAIADDLGTWGEVVRISNIETDLLTYDTSAHTVTLKGAVTTLQTPLDFTKTALNIQLNQGSGYDCLLFTAGDANTRGTLLGSTLNLGADISLTGTGITGFMRDGGTVDKDNNIDTIGKFTGTLNGLKGTDDTYKITLATGEVYGLDSNGNAVTASTEGAGQIYRHKYTGLFAVIGGDTAGTVSNLTVNGSIVVRNRVDGMNIGGIASCNGGSVMLTSVITNDTIKYHEGTSVTGTLATGKNIGGLIGFVGENGTITIGGKCVVGNGDSENPDLILTGNHKSWNVYGGVIGKVTADSFTINVGTVFDSNNPISNTNPFNKLTMKMVVDISGITGVGSNSDCGGLIGHITKAGSYEDREVNINNLEFTGCKIGNAANTNGGGLLGYSWLNATAKIEGMTVTSATISNCTANGTAGGNVNVGAMCYEATGKWVVDKLTVTSLTVSGGVGSSGSIGMLVNKAYTDQTVSNVHSYTGGLYLDVLNSGYTLSTVSLPTTGKYDEIAAYTARDVDDILTGGAGVISINMNDDRNGTKVTVGETTSTVNYVKITDTGTYSNQVSGKTSVVNQTSRYYYNLDAMSKANGGQNLLLWSVKNYAYSDLSSESDFDTTLTTTLSGTADMTGLSFYPVALADGITIGTLNLTFDYEGIEAITGTTMDPGATVVTVGETTTDNRNQHYLMHSGLFLNSSAGSTLTISGTLTLNGNFLEVGKYKGVLISDTMRGSLTCTTGSIVLNGITPKTTGAAAYNSGYLLINNIKRADSTVAIPELKLHNVSTGTGYTSGTTVAKSLIGEAVGPGLKMTFSKVKLDGVASTSIFGESTLVKSIKTDQNAQLIYNFTWDDDWGDANNDSKADRNVTYGHELSDSSHAGSVEYSNKETKYSSGTGSDTHRWYVNPTTNLKLSGAVDFSGYRPYVYQAYTNNTPDTDGYYYREIMVNVEAAGLTDGCGTYNDPYLISTAEQFKSVAAFLQNNDLATTLGNVNLPKTNPGSFISGARWCTENHGEYTASDTSFTAPTGGDAWNIDEVQQYLANAYYKVTADIVLDSGFVGLGGTNANTAFRGVIVGSGTSNGVPTVTITNESDNPFIKVSNGCVVKDINFVIKNSAISFTQTESAYNKAYFAYNYASGDVCKFYGGIIGEIMGGDNIIDNSYVSYTYKDSNNVDQTSIIRLRDNSSNQNGTIVPVGGYVGVIVFGGLIFKNMTASKTTLDNTGLDVRYVLNNTQGKYTVTLDGTNPGEGDKFIVAGVTVTMESGDTLTPTGVATKLATALGSNEYYSVSRSNAVLTLTEKSGKYGTGLPTVATTSVSTTIAAAVKTSPFSGNLAANTEEAWAAIYVNPIVGRVINGYAVNETEDIYETAAQAAANGHETPQVATPGRFTVSEDGKYHDDDKTPRLALPTAAEIAAVENYDNGVEGAVKPSETVREKYNNLSKLHSLQNGTKHYSIADINLSETNKLSFGGEITVNGNTTTLPSIPSSSADGTINIPNSQAFFILSLITQSCAGTAQSATGDYKTSLSYGTYSTKEYGESSNTNHVYGMSHIADYCKVGSATSTSDSDYLLASKDTAGNTTSNYAIPYIIYHYTAADSYGNYPARCVTSTLGYYDINLTGKTANSTEKDANNKVIPLDDYTYQLPDSFRGLGSVGNWDYNSTLKSNAFSMKVDVFDGDDCTIDEDIYLNKFKTDNYFDTLHKGTNQVLNGDNNKTAYSANTNTDNHGIGLFDGLISTDTNEIRNFILTGSVHTEMYSNTYKASGQEEVFVGTAKSSLWLSVGGVVGWSRGTNDSDASHQQGLSFKQIALNDLTICGDDFVGGLLAYSGLKSKDKKIIINECSANNISVKMSSANYGDDSPKARNAIGCFVGKVHEGAAIIYGTSKLANNDDLTKFSTVKIGSYGFGDSSKEYRVAVGGLVGYAGNGCQAYDVKICSYASAVTIGLNSAPSYVGGLVGAMQPSTDGDTNCLAVFKNCTVENINIAGQYAGGLYGGKWEYNNYNPYKIEINHCSLIGNETTHNTISAQYTTSGKQPCAGGLIAWAFVQRRNGDEYNIHIYDSTVSNYNISAAANGYSGGFIGYCRAKNNSITCYIHDSSVENCEIGLGGNDKDYAGGIIGGIEKHDSNKIVGYNIKLDNVSSPNTNRKGTWIGYVNTTDNNTSIQFSGMAVYGDDYNFTQNVGNRSTFSNASFVFADYTGQSYGKNVSTPSALTDTPVFTLNKTNKTITKTVTATTGTGDSTEKKMQIWTYSYAAEPTPSEPVDTEADDSDSWTLSGTTITHTVIKDGKQTTTAYTVTLGSNELYSINEDTKTITRTTIGTQSHQITYNYTHDTPSGTDIEAPDSWSIDETNGKLTRIEGKKKYVYEIAVSGFNATKLVNEEPVNANVAMPKYPFVNINPQSKLGDAEIISCDGAVLYGTDIDKTYTDNGATKGYFYYTDTNNNKVYYPSSKTMAAKIYSELTDNTNSRRYTTFSDDIISSVTVGNNTTNYKILDYMQRTVDDDGDRISTFKTERQGVELQNGVNDFAVVVIATADKNETTNLINRYIQLVTNTTGKNYADTTDPYYHVDIKTCTYENGSFSIDLSQEDGTAGITQYSVEENNVTNYYFDLNRDYADSKNTNTFTLIDIQFIDPFNTSTGGIAYHLYVPVYTVKEMAVNFYAVAKTGAHSVAYPGTNGYESLMSANFNHADSLDTWMTHYIRYEYGADDINTLLNSGKLKWNYEKSINFQTFTAADEDQRLPNSTYMVLVDPNGNSDQVYYAKAGDMTGYSYTDTVNNQTRTCWTVPFSAFKDDSNASMEIASFNKVIANRIVPTLNEDNEGNYQLLHLTESQIAHGDYDVYVITTSGGVSTTNYYNFCVNGDGDYDLAVPENIIVEPNSSNKGQYRLLENLTEQDITDKKYDVCVSNTNEGVTTKTYYEFCKDCDGNYDLTFPYVYEDYYLSIYVPKPQGYKNELYHYSVITPTRFLADAIDYTTSSKPNVRSAGVTQPHTCTILISELFKQTVTDRMTVTPPNEQITANNRTITVDISAVIEPNNPTGVLYMNADEFYHSFYIDLVRYSTRGIESDIQALDESNITATYRIDSDENSTSCANVELDSNYLNVQTFPGTRSESLISELTSGDKQFIVYAKIEMTFDEEKLNEEFPERDPGATYGVNVQAASNLAYDVDTLPYTSMTKKYATNGRYYYIETVPSATLRYASKTDDSDLYDEIGLNSKNQSTLGVNGRSTNEAGRTNMPVNTEAFYNVQSLSRAGDATKLYLTFSLKKKEDSGSPTITGVSYSKDSLYLRSYLEGNITFKSGTSEEVVDLSKLSITEDTITVELDVAGCNVTSNIYDILISFNAKSGTDFSYYANYRVDLKAELYKPVVKDGETTYTNVDNSIAQDYLIYTNAKINPEYLTVPEVASP